MARSNKPIVWGLFAAGGTVTAFVTPVLVVLSLLGGLGLAPVLSDFEAARAIVGTLEGKLVLLGVVGLTLWSAAHRLRITVHDFGVRADPVVAFVVYALALGGTGAAALALIRL